MSDDSLFNVCKECIVKSTCSKNICNTDCEEMLKESIKEHLKFNFYPPITNQKTIDVVIEIIQKTNQGISDFIIVTPKGEKIHSNEIIEDLHLQDFLKGEL